MSWDVLGCLGRSGRYSNLYFCKYTDNCNTCVDAHIRLRQPNLRRIKIIKPPNISAPETPHQKEVHLLVAHLPQQLRATLIGLV